MLNRMGIVNAIDPGKLPEARNRPQPCTIIRLLFLYANYARETDWTFYCTLDHAAERCGTSRRTVSAVRNYLKRNGLIEDTKRRVGATPGCQTEVFQLRFDKLMKLLFSQGKYVVQLTGAPDLDESWREVSDVEDTTGGGGRIPLAGVAESATKVTTEKTTSPELSLEGGDAEEELTPKAVVQIYNHVLPHWKKALRLNPAREKRIRAIVKTYPNARSADWWYRYFDYAGALTYLNRESRTERAPDQQVGEHIQSWCGIDFILHPDGFTKMIERQYEFELNGLPAMWRELRYRKPKEEAA
jgi:hypothetical protein